MKENEKVLVIGIVLLDYVCVCYIHLASDVIWCVYILGVQNTFSIITPYKGYIVQSLEEKDVFDWLYALNPLLAGQIKSQLGNKRRNNPTS